jgi:hypothetical protein
MYKLIIVYHSNFIEFKKFIINSIKILGNANPKEKAEFINDL